MIFILFVFIVILCSDSYNIGWSILNSIRKTKLSRETRVTIYNNTNKQSKEYIITYDDINAQTTENNILGSGRFGVVWKIDHKESKSKFAVKVIFLKILYKSLNILMIYFE